MRHCGRLVCAALCLVLARSARADGEVFRISPKATEYCADFDATRLKLRNANPLWIRIDGPGEATLSLTRSFLAGTTVPLRGTTYQQKGGKAALIASAVFETGEFISVQGIAKVKRKTGEVRSIRGTFVQDGLFDSTCFSSGSFKTIDP